MMWTILLYTYSKYTRGQREPEKKEYMIYFYIVFFGGHEVHLHLCGLYTRFDGCACFLSILDKIKVVAFDVREVESQTKGNNRNPDTNIKPST